MFVLESSLDYNECHHVVGVFSSLDEAKRQANSEPESTYELQWITEFKVDNLQPMSSLFRSRKFDEVWGNWTSRTTR